MIDRFLNVQQLAALTGWSVFIIYRKSAAGEIPGKVKLGKNSLRFRESVIEQWLAPKQSAEHAETVA